MNKYSIFRLTIKRYIYLSVLLLLFISTFYLIRNVDAQDERIIWSHPLEISNSLTYSANPSITADQFGYVHLVWVEDVGGLPISSSEDSPQAGNTILYRRWDGENWSIPVDIIASEDNSLSYPEIKADKIGLLHLTWRDWGGLYYSNASISNSMDVKSWKKGELIAGGNGFGASIVVDDDNVIHMVYENKKIQETGEKDGNVYYINSPDQGQTWTSPVNISLLPKNTETLSDRPLLAVDSQNTLHVVWYTIDPPNWLGSVIFYSKSIDQGKNWTSPQTFYQSNGGVWASKPEIAVIEPEEIHIAWTCGELPYRCHKYSKDGGETWSGVSTKIFGDLLSLAYWDTMAVDGTKTLYWVLQLREPEALYYTFWNGSSWENPPLLLSDDPQVQRAHGPELTIRNGNEFNLVAVYPPQGNSIWYFNAIKDILSQPTLELNIPSGEVTLQSEESSFTPTPTQTNNINSFLEVENVSNPINERPSFPILLGILPVLAILIIVIIYSIFIRS